MAKAAFIKRNGVLVPMDEDGRDLVAAMKDGRQVMVNVHPARSPRHHRLLFALLKLLVDGGAWQGDRDDLLDYLKIATHLVRTIVGADGTVYHVPKSIAWESMDQAAFARWFDRAIYVVCARLVPGQDWQALRDEIIESVDGPLRPRIAA